ncbi:glutamate-cysteine ligase family protein [Streptomyces sp. NPDC059037]|uniref:glutamate-cysteine ligase family protein n=1 Tax=Streptomyces sp. NPDC059037 TaxID=3346710 RepID=UPI00369CBD8F
MCGGGGGRGPGGAPPPHPVLATASSRSTLRAVVAHAAEQQGVHAVFIGLMANSPYWAGRDTGYASRRTMVRARDPRRRRGPHERRHRPARGRRRAARDGLTGQRGGSATRRVPAPFEPVRRGRPPPCGASVTWRPGHFFGA